MLLIVKLSRLQLESGKQRRHRSLDQLLLFLPAAVLVAASPGANNLLAFANGARSGFGPAVVALVGRFSAFALMIAAVAVGLGAILAASETAFHLIKWIGVAYLLWLGVRMWRARSLDLELGSQEQALATGMHLAGREFWVALTNPKAVLLFTAFLPQFVLRSHDLAPQLIALGALYILVEFCAAAGYAFAGSRVRSLELGERGSRNVNRITGGMMLAAAGLLAASRRG